MAMALGVKYQLRNKNGRKMILRFVTLRSV
jgi:hypothetical protein